MKFSYIRFEMFYKPVLPVIFKFKNQSFPYQALIDTGADISIIHSEIADQLGIDITSGGKFPFAGICGRSLGYLHKLDLEIGGYAIPNVPIVFSSEISPYGFGILGHEGLFDQIKMVFEFGKKQFEIIPKSYK